MKNLRRTLAAGAVAGGLVLGFAGVAGAQTAPEPTNYTPDVSPTTVIDDPGAEVLGATVSAADADAAGAAGATAVSAAGTLPYTGNDSSLPLAEIGAGLLAAGGLAVVVVRRQQAKA
jgi:LPXTG-motif cell wall-anchored protein